MTTSHALDPRRPIGRYVLQALSHVGRVSLMLAEMGRALGEWRVWLPRTFTEAWHIGVGSLPIILLVAGFAGAVTALQTGYQFTGNIPYYVAGSLIVESVVLELGSSWPAGSGPATPPNWGRCGSPSRLMPWRLWAALPRVTW